MDLEFIQCQSNAWVPVLNGILLHSSINPEKEAAQFIDQEWDRLKDMKSVLIFGLGGGFHIEELLRRKNFNVVVVEAEKEIARAVAQKNPTLFEKVSVVAGVPASHISSEFPVVNAMAGTCGILRHPTSQRVSSFYYKAVTQLLNERTLGRLRQLAQGNLGLAQFLDSLDISADQILTLPMVEEAMLRRGGGLDREGLIWMMMRELII